MRGLARAEWLRLRKRRSLQVIVLAVPILAAFFFVAGYSSIYEPPPFDEATRRAELIAEGYVEGVPPEEVEQFLAELLESERASMEQWREQVVLARAGYAYPQSVVTVLGSGTLVLFALILLTATTIGDEFSWGTIRTTLLASSRRPRLLFVRFVALAALGAFTFALLILLGVLLPFVLQAAGAPLPQPPAIDGGALLVLLAGHLVAVLAVIAFAALATLTVRSGSLTLVVVLVYVVVEAAILALFTRFESFQGDGENAWLITTLPVRGIAAIGDTASRVASAMAHYPGEEIVRDLGPVWVPLAALMVWATLFAALAFRRFSRMDIVE